LIASQLQNLALAFSFCFALSRFSRPASRFVLSKSFAFFRVFFA
jgi:hypothetical protein